MTVPERLLSRPGHAVALLCAGQAFFWTLAPALTHNAPPLDIVEMLVWGREGVVATYKHPNLPGLLLEAVRRLSSGALWPLYLLAQACVTASFAAVWLLGRDLLGPGRALAGTLLLTGIFYYSWPTPEMNHNLVQMPFWAWTCLALWRSAQGERIVWWLLLGVFAGLSLWAKYSSGLLLAAVILWILVDTPARAQFTRLGPWAALAVFAAITAPQAIFLVTTEFLPFDYALARAGSGGAGGPLSFLLTQLADHTVFLLMALAAGLFGRGASQRQHREARARCFLLIMGLLPALLAVLAAGATGMGLKDMWGMPMFNLSGLLLLALLPGRFDAGRLARIAVMAAVLLTAVPAGYAASVLFRAERSDKPSRVLWPQEEIAARLLRHYENEIGTQPQIVAGPVWEAGLVALTAPSAPSVFIDADGRKSPWIAAEDIARKGALLVWRAGAKPAPGLAALAAGRTLRQETFLWSQATAARPISITWTIVPPQAPGTRKDGLVDR
ncbi:MAG: glycosyltransferase family 39 protein [Alphaproteobacteria bacterium]|nr:glycosyltransferase family 39 protein [Alphaproteobacteria bacterium]MCY4320097.1 glycosyltransferase family 39 protein [Alphaproteobacteria bacterium]